MSFPIDVVLVDGIQYLVDQTQMHPLGTRGVSAIDGDCRAWRYTKLATTTRTDGYGGYAPGLGLFSNGTTATVTIVTATAGKESLSATVSGMTANEYQGGLLSMFEAGQPIVMMGIKSNLATGVTDNITLDGKLPGNYTSSATAYITPGPYKEVIIAGVSTYAGGLFEPCVGVFNSPEDKDGTTAAAGDWCWIQTWGPCEMWCSGAYYGGTTAEREVVVQGDGAAQVNTALEATTHLGYQRIGFLYTYTGNASENIGEHGAGGAGAASAFMKHLIFLQIAP